MSDDDLDALLAPGPRPSGKECATGWALQRLDPTTAEKFRTAMAYNVNPDDLAAAFASRGYPWATPMSIRRHAQGGCRICADRQAAA